MTESIEQWLRPHIAAIQASVRAGFRFLHMPALGVIRGFRDHAGAVDTFDAWGPGEASGFRFRLEDFGEPGCTALWSRRGAVDEVVWALLELPEHGEPGAPVLARRFRPCGFRPGCDRDVAGRGRVARGIHPPTPPGRSRGRRTDFLAWRAEAGPR